MAIQDGLVDISPGLPGNFVAETNFSEVIGSTEWERAIVDETYDPGTTPQLFTVVEVIDPQ